MFTFGRTPHWASSKPTEACTFPREDGCAAPPSDLDSGDVIVKNFTTALVNHSRASATAHIKYYELWNEPDLRMSWSGSAAQLVTMGRDIAEIVHRLDPSAKVVGPAPGTANRFGVHFLPAYYAAGGAPYQDIVGIHAYLYDGSTLASTPEGIVDSITHLRALMNAYGIGSKPVFYTEGTWGGEPTDTTMTTDQKVAYLAREHLLMWMHGVDRYYWYQWDNPGWGQLASNGALLPTGVAYGILQSWLVGSTHVPNQCAEDANGTWTCSLVRKNGGPALILWNPNGAQTVAVPATHTHYLTLDSTSVHAIAAHTVTAGLKPIMVTP
jgi:hypothetical protein